MKMTKAWMQETADHLAENGFEVSTTQTPEKLIDGTVAFERTRHEVSRGEHESFLLDVLEYPDGEERYWLHLVEWHALSTFPYRLDSWRHRPDRVEFKFHVDPESGTGLAFTLRL